MPEHRAYRIKQKRPADDLERTDHMHVVAQKKRLAEVAEKSWRRRRHWDEEQENVQTEHDKNKPEKNAGNNGNDFHARMVA